MKVAPIALKPDFKLMKQNDIQSYYYIQMPCWLFFDQKYRSLSLTAKTIYSLLLNRHKLSSRKNWLNEDGEVFIIYSREELSGDIQVSYRKIIESMKELAAAKLIWERRCGQGKANQIYLAQVELSDVSASVYGSTPFIHAEHEAAGARPARSALRDDICGKSASPEEDGYGCLRPVEETYPDVRQQYIKNCENGTSGYAVAELPDLQDRYASNIDFSDIDNNIYPSQSVRFAPAARLPRISDRRTDIWMEELEQILEHCDLVSFAPETASVFASAIERLFFTEQYRIGGAVLPQEQVRSHLRCLDYQRLREAERKIAGNTEQNIRNTTAYTMAVIFNSIREIESDILLDPYLNRLKSRAPTHIDSGRW